MGVFVFRAKSLVSGVG